MCQYSSIAHTCLYALQLRFETFVDTIKDKTTGSVIFESVRRAEQILFNIPLCLQYVNIILAISRIPEKKFEKYMCSIFLQLVSLSKRPTDLYEMPPGNQQREWILIFGYMKDASNVEFWIADVSALLYAIWTAQVCRLSLRRLLGRRSSLLNRQHEIEFHLYFDEPRCWPATVRLEFDSGQGYYFFTC